MKIEDMRAVSDAHGRIRTLLTEREQWATDLEITRYYAAKDELPLAASNRGIRNEVITATRCAAVKVIDAEIDEKIALLNELGVDATSLRVRP